MGLTNLTTEEVVVTVASGRSGCQLHVGDTPDQPSVTLFPAEHSDVKVTATSGCVDDGGALAFSVTADGRSFPIEAKEEAKSTPDWTQLRAFGAALIAMLIFALVFWAMWDLRDRKLDPIWQPLPHLEDGWSFKESWVSNVTVGGSLLTGVLGTSSVVTAFLGKNADSAVALATVGAAIAVAMVAAGSIVLQAGKTTKGEFTVVGVLLASVVTLSAALGELWVVYQSGKDLPLGDVANYLIWFIGFAVALLLLYAVRSWVTLFDAGITAPLPTDPLKPPLSETIFAASMIVAALEPGADAAKVDAAIGMLREASVKSELLALKANPRVDGERLDVVVTQLRRAKPALELDEVAKGVRMLVDGRPLRIDTAREETVLARFDKTSVAAAVENLVGMHKRIDEPHAKAAIAKILADEPILVAPRARPRAALL